MGTTCDFLTSLEMETTHKAELRISEARNFFKSDFSNKNNSTLCDSNSLPLSISSSLDLRTGIKSESFHFIAPSLQKLSNTLDAKQTVQSFLSVRNTNGFTSQYKQAASTDQSNSTLVLRRESILANRSKNQYRSSKIMTSNLSLLLPALSEYLKKRTGFFVSETNTSGESSKSKSIRSSSGKSLNSKINSTLMNLITLNQRATSRTPNENRQVSLLENKFYSSHRSTLIEYFDPVTHMDQYIDLTPSTFKTKTSVLNSQNTSQLANYIDRYEHENGNQQLLDGNNLKRIVLNPMVRAVSTYSSSTSSSRPVSVAIHSCCVVRQFCFRNKRKQSRHCKSKRVDKLKKADVESSGGNSYPKKTRRTLVDKLLARNKVTRYFYYYYWQRQHT